MTRLESWAVIGQLFVRASSLQRKRAFLTVAAIAWGTVAILLLLAFGEGLRHQIGRSKRGMGENLAVFWPGTTSKVWQGLPRGRAVQPRVEDLAYLRSRLPDLAGIVGEITDWTANLSWGETSQTGRVTGTNWEFGHLRYHYPRRGGRFLNARDEAEKRRVVFLGDKLARQLFGSAEPVGETIQLGGSPYLVVGVLQPKFQMGSYKGMDEDHALIPITTFAAQFGRQHLNNIVFQVDRPEQMASALIRFREAMGSRYRFDPTDNQALNVWDTVESGKIMANVMIGIQAFLGIVGALTLMIGGIGVANIMYAVVKEKTKEIGVQMALGARRSWITGPYVLQGLLYTLLGGAAGITISVLLILLLGLIPVEGNDALEFLGKPTLSGWIGAATALILGVIGVAAGYFPARRAAAIDPATTLRYE